MYTRLALLVCCLAGIAECDDLKPFAKVTEGAQKIAGLFNIYKTEDKTLLEIWPEQVGKRYLFLLTMDSAIGERGFYGLQTGLYEDYVLRFERHGNTVLAVLDNYRFLAREGAPIAEAVAKSFSDSILGAAKIESRPHPDTKAVLVDMASFFLTDFPRLGQLLETEFRQPYKLDAKSSVFGTLRGYERNVEIESVLHYTLERAVLPPLLAPGTPEPPKVYPPANLPDDRSMRLRIRYSLVERPGPGYRPRLADDRVGYFGPQLEDFTDDLAFSPRVRYINRWRLEKTNPAAAVAPVKQPITYWIEKTVPVKYHQAIREGVLAWNPAFERLGFQNAIEVKVQPPDADWDAADVRYHTIRFFAGTDEAYAVAGERTDPLTGEIVDADISISESLVREYRKVMTDRVIQTGSPPRSPANHQLCEIGKGLAVQMRFGMSVLMAQGIAPDSPEAAEFLDQVLRDLVSHEVGHTLGLRHNFRASSIRSLKAMLDPSFRGPFSGSVMDYNSVVLLAKNLKRKELYLRGIGPYDLFAIEYGYKPLAAASPEEERKDLDRIAARSRETDNAFAPDEDAGSYNNPDPLDMDPNVTRWDASSNPLEFYGYFMGVIRELWDKMESNLLKRDRGFEVLRQSFDDSLALLGRYTEDSAKYIGGMYHARVRPGDASGLTPIEPVEAARQREALEFLKENLFGAGAFAFSKRMLNELDGERLYDRFGVTPDQRGDYPVYEKILDIQRAVLDRLFHPLVLSRIVNSDLRTDVPYHAGELFRGLEGAIWEEAGEGKEINSFRRSLQREHLRRLIQLVLQNSKGPEDARSQARLSLESIRGRIAGSLRKNGRRLSPETRAHLGESSARIEEALRASAQRTAF